MLTILLSIWLSTMNFLNISSTFSTGNPVAHFVHQGFHLAPAVSLYSSCGQKEVALTFDDGPYGSSTARILAILEQEKVPATFFLLGKNVEKYPDQVRQEIADGDVIGNHSYSHSRLLPTMTSDTLRADLTRAQNAITGASGGNILPHLFRAPYGAVSAAMLQEVAKEGYILVPWTLDPRDWDNTNSSSTVESSILKKIHQCDIILLHDGHESGPAYSRLDTIGALPGIIDSLKNEGYSFVTVDTILHVAPYRK